MESAEPATSTRLLFAALGIVGIAVSLALATDLALVQLTLPKLAFVLGGVALLIPTLVVKDSRAYWLFLLVLSIPFDITKWLSIGIVDSQALVDTYGEPMSGTIGLEVYLSDIVLIAMVLSWIGRISLNRETLYFPKVGYMFVFYLAWAVLVSIINAPSIALSIFELFRESLYFVSFVYLINNVSTRVQFRSVVWAVILGLIIGAGSVIVFFERGIGTDTVAFAGLHDEPAAGTTRANKKISPDIAMSVQGGGRNLGSMGRIRGIKRSQGMFRHPAIAAGVCAVLLPTILAYLVVATRSLDRILYCLVYAWGFVALLLTFSRAGFIGFLASNVVFLVLGSWSGLISRKVVARAGIAVIVVVALGMPLVVTYLQTRPDSLAMRFYMFEAAIDGYSQHPVLGVGLNNSTAAMRAGRQELKDMGIPAAPEEPADSYYLAILTEVGPVGSILFFGFFVNIVMIAFGAIRDAGAEMKPLLVGMVAGIAALATQSIADGPLAGHAVSGTLWLFAALIVAIRRNSPVAASAPLVGAATDSFRPGFARSRRR